MTRNEILNQISDLVEALRDDIADDGDAGKGKVVWPLRGGGGIGYNNALTTLCDIADCSLDVSWFGPDRKTPASTLNVVFDNTESYPGSPGIYAWKPLKQILQEDLERGGDEDDEGVRLLKRLIKAFGEP